MATERFAKRPDVGRGPARGKGLPVKEAIAADKMKGTWRWSGGGQE